LHTNNIFAENKLFKETRYGRSITLLGELYRISGNAEAVKGKAKRKNGT